MDSSTFFLIAADAILLLHGLFVVFVVIGMALIFIGKVRVWSWVRNPWFRLTHLVAIAVVVVQSWFGLICPLTTLEMALRSRAGDKVYSGSFIQYWLESILYYQLPSWVFVVVYMVFGAVVVASWFWIRPRRF
jgi:uncharacterized protein DUF2784